MRLISFVVPCYNSQSYMEHCIRTLIPGGKMVEIIIVDDGSTDNTGAIADRYAEKYPDLVRVIHQENKGHGGAINTGLAEATGLYFKVVDSDDWVDRSSYKKILYKIKELAAAGQTPDMLINNFVYEKAGAKRKKVMNYHDLLPVGRVFTWEETGRFNISRYILMHSTIYKTQLLRDCGLKLPEHMFYVDNLFLYKPLPYIKTMYYMDVNFYRYFIGREDQSVNETVMIGRIDQQLAVNRMLFEAYDPWDIPEKRQREYALMYLEIITMVSTILLIRSGTEEHLQKKRALWREIRRDYPRLYAYLRAKLMGILFTLPGKMGNRLVVLLYLITKKMFDFN